MNVEIIKIPEDANITNLYIDNDNNTYMKTYDGWKQLDIEVDDVLLKYAGKIKINKQNDIDKFPRGYRDTIEWVNK